MGEGQSGRRKSWLNWLGAAPEPAAEALEAPEVALPASTAEPPPKPPPVPPMVEEQGDDALIRRFAQVLPPAALPEKGDAPVPMAPIDFGAVFDAAGLVGEDLDRVSRADELLQALPGDTPDAAKRRIVASSLETFGVSTQRIMEAAKRQGEGLEAFIRASHAQHRKRVTEGEQRITALQAEVERLRQALKAAGVEDEARSRASNAQMLKVQAVLDFFQGKAERPADDGTELDEPTVSRGFTGKRIATTQTPAPPTRPGPGPTTPSGT